MICGFFGTVISLERAVALGAGWAYAAPLAAGLATLALLAGMLPAAIALYVAAGALLTLATLIIVRRQPALFTLTLALNAAAWLARQDAALLALLVGFVFAMVFGHAPIIFPAVLCVQLPYSPWFYLPLALLHASVAIRLLGDLRADAALLRWGGAASALALAAFIVTMATAGIRGTRSVRR